MFMCVRLLANSAVVFHVFFMFLVFYVPLLIERLCFTSDILF